MQPSCDADAVASLHSTTSCERSWEREKVARGFSRLAMPRTVHQIAALQRCRRSTKKERARRLQGHFALPITATNVREGKRCKPAWERLAVPRSVHQHTALGSSRRTRKKTTGRNAMKLSYNATTVRWKERLLVTRNGRQKGELLGAASKGQGNFHVSL